MEPPTAWARGGILSLLLETMMRCGLLVVLLLLVLDMVCVMCDVADTGLVMKMSAFRSWAFRRWVD